MPVNEILLSFSDNIKKSRNPFFGTFIIVWMVRNWQFILTLFNLDLYATMEEKVEALKDYFADNTIVLSFLITASISLLVLVVTYLLLNLARLISNFFEKIVAPWVYQITDKNSIVLKFEYKALQKELSQMEARVLDERMRRVQAEQERDSLEARIKSQGQVLTDSGKADRDELVQHIHSQLDMEGRSVFRSALTKIRQNESLAKEDSHTIKLLQLGLIKHREDSFKGLAFYTLTDQGERYASYLVEAGLMME